MGWSNGSILSTSLITTYPDRYKVASVGAGDVEWISDWGNVAFGKSFDAYYFGKSPMQDPQLYINKSPFFKMDKVQGPGVDFSRYCGYQRTSRPELVVFPRAPVLRQSASQICRISRRAARATQADAPDAQGRPKKSLGSTSISSRLPNQKVKR